MEEAEIYLMKQVQLSSFYTEIRAMQNGDDICNKCKILNLSPFLDDKGIIRVGGRLKHSRLPYSSKHPILLPAKTILNSRPITPLSSDVDDLEVLTPAHFLIGRPITAIVEPSLLQCESNRLNVWQRITKSVQTIWKRWSLSYLNSLQQRKKWIVNKENLKLGDMVLIREENLPPCKWLLGRVVKIYMGKDKKVRVVDIKTGKVEGFDCKEATECFKCNLFIHTADNCYLTPRCIKCGNDHQTRECQIKRVDSPFCINCQIYGHMANYSKCPLYPKPREGTEIKTNYTNTVNSIVRSNTSYATITKTTSHSMLPPTDGTPLHTCPSYRTTDYTKHRHRNSHSTFRK
ncbi:DUF5641 domain-containing protein [Trichonephila clavipes]|nr:DUF5641 domain-containing protein [Trichonephila clavipes]